MCPRGDIFYGKHSDNNGGYLNTLFSPSVLPDEKKNVLSKKYNIAMTAELESEVQRMCNLSTAIENQGIKKGRVEGVDLMAKLVKILLAEKTQLCRA